MPRGGPRAGNIGSNSSSKFQQNLGFLIDLTMCPIAAARAAGLRYCQFPKGVARPPVIWSVDSIEYPQATWSPSEQQPGNGPPKRRAPPVADNADYVNSPALR
jgi:hypothetical protein